MSSGLHRALNVLEAFTVTVPEWGVTELAAKLEIPNRTAHCTSATIEGCGHEAGGGKAG